MSRDLARFRRAFHSSAANRDNTAQLTTSDAPMSWISGGGEREWVAVDLGAPSRITAVQVKWGDAFALRYSVQLSQDGETWIDGAFARGVANALVETAVDGQASWVRVLCLECSGARYEIDKIHVL